MCGGGRGWYKRSGRCQILFKRLAGSLAPSTHLGPEDQVSMAFSVQPSHVHAGLTHTVLTHRTNMSARGWMVGAKKTGWVTIAATTKIATVQKNLLVHFLLRIVFNHASRTRSSYNPPHTGSRGHPNTGSRDNPHGGPRGLGNIKAFVADILSWRSP